MSSTSIEDYAKKEEDVTVEVASYDGTDDTQLEMLGYKPEFKRDFSFLGLFSLCSSELAVLPGVAGTIWYVSPLSRIHSVVLSSA